MNERTAKLTIILGTNGTGKTTLLRRILETSTQRALIITPDAVEWTDCRETDLSRQSDFVFSGIRRHVFDPETTLNKIKFFRKGVIVFDDCRSYLGDTTDPRIRDLFIRRRQRELDVFCVGHGFTQVPPVFFTFASDYILFRTVDNIDRRKNCINAGFDFIKQSQIFVNQKAKENPHFFRHLKIV